MKNALFVVLSIMFLLSLLVIVPIFLVCDRCSPKFRKAINFAYFQDMWEPNRGCKAYPENNSPVVTEALTSRAQSR